MRGTEKDHFIYLEIKKNVTSLPLATVLIEWIRLNIWDFADGVSPNPWTLELLELQPTAI